MNKRNKLIALLLCVVLVFTTAQSAFAFFDAFKDLSEDEGVRITVKGTVVKEPPYYIWLEMKFESPNRSPVWTSLIWILEGKKTGLDNQIEG